jgi:FAD/FMN-containing dehydrogenase
VLPEASAEQGMREVLMRVSDSGNASFLAVLKRLGAEGKGYLSFPMPGYTLALDIPLRAETLPLLDVLDQIVLSYGGRVYLAKDSRMSAQVFQQMYPRLQEWQAIRHQLDPAGQYVSALGFRLGMC